MGQKRKRDNPINFTKNKKFKINKLDKINQYLNKCNYYEINNLPEFDTNIIYNLYFNNHNFIPDNNYPAGIFNLAAIYYEINNNYILAEKYYLISVKKKLDPISLACFYENKIKNIPKAIKYYKLSKNPIAANNLGIYYEEKKKILY